MGISQKIKAAMKLLKEIAHEYSTMTRKNKCIPGTKKKGRMSKKGTKKSVRFNKPLAPEEPVSNPVSNSVEPEEEEPVQQPVELSEENPFEQSMEPEEETETEPNPVDDGLTEPKA